MDGVEYMQLPSFPMKVNPKFADVEGGKADVERAVFEHQLFFLNNAGEIVTAQFKGGVLEEGAKPTARPEAKRVAFKPKKTGFKIKGIYEYDGATPQETKCFVKAIRTVCDNLNGVPKLVVSSDGTTTTVRIREAIFKTRSGAVKAMQEMRGLISHGSKSKRMIMTLPYEVS